MAETPLLAESNNNAPGLARPLPPSLSERAPDTIGVPPQVHKPPAVPILLSLPSASYAQPKVDTTAGLPTEDSSIKAVLFSPAPAVVSPAQVTAAKAEAVHPEDLTTEATTYQVQTSLIEDAPKAPSAKASPFAFKVTCQPAAPAPMSFSAALAPYTPERATGGQIQEQVHEAASASAHASIVKPELPSGPAVEDQAKEASVDMPVKGSTEKEEDMASDTAASPASATAFTTEKLPTTVLEFPKSSPSPFDAETTSLSTSAGVEVIFPSKPAPLAVAPMLSLEEVDDLPPLIQPEEPVGTLMFHPSKPPSSPTAAPSVTPVFITEPPQEKDSTMVEPVVKNNKGIPAFPHLPVLHGS